MKFKNLKENLYVYLILSGLGVVGLFCVWLIIVIVIQLLDWLLSFDSIKSLSQAIGEVLIFYIFPGFIIITLLVTLLMAIYYGIQDLHKKAIEINLLHKIKTIVMKVLFVFLSIIGITMFIVVSFYGCQECFRHDIHPEMYEHRL